MRTKSIVFTGPFQVEIREYDLRKLEEGEVLVKTICTGVSPGTELRVLSGKQKGGEFPLIPGYENVGKIFEVGKGVKNLREGMVVFSSGTQFTGPYNRVWGGQTEYSIIKEEDAILIPSEVDPIYAVFTKTCAIALHGVRRANISDRDKVAIVGQGLIGHLATQMAKIKGAFVIAVDTVEERLKASKMAGADYIVDAKEKDVYKEVMEITEGGVDVAIDVTGIASNVDSTANLLKPRPYALKPTDNPNPSAGRLLILGSYTDPVCFNYHPTLFDHEIDILVSRDCTYFDLLEALSLIKEEKINFEAIKFEIFDFRNAGEGYKKLMNKEIIKAIFRWN